MLFSQGISTAEELAGRIVLLFQLCEEQLSSQSHYDFGLRALKSVLVGAGGLKRKALQEAAASGTGIGRLSGEGEHAAGAGLAGDAALLGPVERDVLIRYVGVCGGPIGGLSVRVLPATQFTGSLVSGVFVPRIASCACIHRCVLLRAGLSYKARGFQSSVPAYLCSVFLHGVLQWLFLVRSLRFMLHRTRTGDMNPEMSDDE